MGPKEKRDAAIKRQQEILSKAKAEGREELTPEEQREFNDLQDTIDICTKALTVVPEHRQQDKGNPDDDPDKVQERARGEERTRINTINEMCRQFGMEEDARGFIDNGSTEDQVRAAILEKLMQRGGPVPSGRKEGGIDVTGSEEDKFRGAMVDALLMRGGVSVEKPAEGAMQLRGMSLRDLAIESIKGEEKNASRMSSDELFERMLRQYYNPSAAFPSIMDQTINKAYKQGYNEVGTTFEAFCAEGSLSDFKASKREYLAGPAGEFKRVNENGELQSDTPTDELLPTRKLETYGRQFTMTRQAFINDDIGFLTSVPARYAKSAKATINKQVYGILAGNPAIYDGVALFDSEKHKNVVTVAENIGGPTNAAIQSMIVGLSMQKNQFGESIMIRPGAIVVPVGYGFAIQTILESATISTAGNTQAVNPLYKFRSSINVVEDPTLNALAEELKLSTVPWFMAADKNDCAGIQVDYLNGQKIPTIKRSERPGTLGFVWDIYLDWGITVVDYRGLVKNPGEKLNIKL